ncbi:MAG: DUF1570 domain-containing protein [Gemmataceae bacterium]
MLPLVLLLIADGPPGADDWKYDVVRRKGGGTLVGLVLEHNKSVVRIKCIRRKPGSPTLLYTDTLARDEVSELELLDDADRKALEQRLETLKRERELLSALTRSLDPRDKPAAVATDFLELKKAPWPGDEKLDALRYRSAHFELIAATRPELVQLAALHLEQVYAAFARMMPPRVESESPTTVLLTRSLAEYQAVARGRGLNLFNPAFYDPDRNQVVCGSDLDRLGDERDKVRAHHAGLRAGIRERRGELLKIYRGKTPAGLLAPLTDAEARIARSEERNDQVIGRVRERLFQRLYHEAFHAYLGTFVYPGKENAVPVWLNEGLAQIFEAAIVEVGELRVGHADPERLAAAREALAKGTLPSVADLLRSGPKEFQVAHAAEQLTADRHYLAAWALAHYLTFDRRLLGTKALDGYVKALGREAGPAEAFRDLVGEPLPKFEEAFQAYLRKLRPDGSTGK